MKKLIKISLAFCILFFVLSCKTRNRQLQKTEVTTEKTSAATVKIKTDSAGISTNKLVSNSSFANSVQNSENKKDETKNVEIIKEYYENGTLKKEMQKSFSQLSEATRTAIAEINEKLTLQTENAKFWKSSSDSYYKLYQEEKQKYKTKNLSVKSKPTYTWQMFFVGLFLGWLLLPKFFRWIWSMMLRFVPFANFLDSLKKFKI